MKNIILFDWLSASIHVNSDWQLDGDLSDGSAFCNLLGISFDRFTSMAGVKGFKSRLYFDGISIHLPSDHQPYVWLEMSGQGCRCFESFGYGNWDYLLSVLYKNFKINRIDIAYDDHNSILPINQIVNDTIARNYISKARKHNIEISFDDTKDFIGYSIYHGSQSSNVLIRIYDKGAQLEKEENWIRCEIQLRDDNAIGFVSQYLQSNNIGVLFRGVLSHYLRYIQPTRSDSNIWRSPLTDYWDKLIQDCDRIRIASNKGVVYNLSNLENYVINQAGNAILTYIKIFGYFRFKEELEKNNNFLPPKYEALLKEYGG